MNGSDESALRQEPNGELPHDHGHWPAHFECHRRYGSPLPFGRGISAAPAPASVLAPAQNAASSQTSPKPPSLIANSVRPPGAPKPVPPMKPLPPGSTVRDAQQALDQYAEQTGQTYKVDPAQFAPGRPVPKTTASNPDVPDMFTYLTPQACGALGDSSWIDFLNGGVGRLYNHYQWCGWKRITPVGGPIVNGVERHPTGALPFRMTIIGWGSKSASELIIRFYADDVVVPSGSTLTPGNTSLFVKPRCEFQIDYTGSCSFSSPTPTATILDMQSGMLEFKVTVNLPANTAANPDARAIFNLVLDIGAASTSEIGTFSEFITVSPAIRCDAAPQDRGGFTTPACVFGGVTPQWNLNTNDSAIGQVAQHIQRAQTNPNSTLPPDPSGTKIIPSKLQRTTDDFLNKAQRDRATYQCRKWIVPVPADESCDEYPFASTYEGSFNEPETNYSVAAVSASQNSSEGGSRIGWYKADRILEGDAFDVITYTQ
jgi:hypothetical protein